MKYFVSIGGRTVEVELTGDRVLVDGRAETAELRGVPGTPLKNLLIGGVSWIVPMEPLAPGRWLVQRRGERFEVEVVDERTHHIRSLVGAGAGPPPAQMLRAPMPGLVVRVLVAPGAQVDLGTPLVVLEAMKMENELKAAGPGTVEGVEVEPGQAVEKGAVLVRLSG